MPDGLPRSNKKQVPRTFSPVYSSVWPFCRSFTPEQIRTNQHPRKSLKVQNQFSLNKLHSASKLAFQSPKSTFDKFVHLCCQVTLSDNNHWCHRSWRTHHSPTQSWTRFLLYMGSTDSFGPRPFFKIVAQPVLMESLTSISSSARPKEKARTEDRNSLHNIWLSLTNENQKFKQAYFETNRKSKYMMMALLFWAVISLAAGHKTID